MYAVRRLVMAAVLLGFQSAAVLSDEVRDAFYLPPAPLPSAKAGTVIRTMPLTDSAALPSAGRNLLVLFHSKTIDGRDVAVSGTIAIPAGSPPKGGWPVTTWGHGTTGIGPACAPSKDTPDGPEHGFLGPKQILMDGYVKRGYVVVATDYEGLGGPSIHPFLQGVSEAHGILDIVRAARQIEPGIGSRYLAIGHSQGGHADLFAAALGPDYAPELELLGNVAMAPASHIKATIEGMTVAAEPSYALGYVMYVLQSFASNHADLDLKTILAPVALEHLAQTRLDCISKTVSEGYWATAVPKDQFLANADFSQIFAIAAANEPATLKISVPTFIAQGTKDTTVLPPWTDALVRSLCSNDVAVQYEVFPGADHETVVTRSADDVKSWVDARFSSIASQSNCSALPTAGAQ